MSGQVDEEREVVRIVVRQGHQARAVEWRFNDYAGVDHVALRLTRRITRSLLSGVATNVGAHAWEV